MHFMKNSFCIYNFLEQQLRILILHCKFSFLLKLLGPISTQIMKPTPFSLFVSSPYLFFFFIIANYIFSP